MNCVLFDEYEQLCVMKFECGMNCVVACENRLKF